MYTHTHTHTHTCIFCGYEVTGMILLRDLKGTMRLDRSKDMSVHVSASCMEVVALVRRVCFYVSSQNE